MLTRLGIQFLWLSFIGEAPKVGAMYPLNKGLRSRIVVWKPAKEKLCGVIGDDESGVNPVHGGE